MYQNPAHQAGTTSNPHLRPQGSAPLDPNPKSNLSEEELAKYFDQFCESVASRVNEPVRAHEADLARRCVATQMRTCFVNS